MLNKALLKATIVEILTPTNIPGGQSLTPEQMSSINQQADKWANAIEEFVKSGTVTHAPGTVTGITPGWSGPLENGSATSGVIS